MATDKDSFFELKLKINPQMSEIISDICFDKLACEGILSSDEDFEDGKSTQNLSENTLTIYLSSDKNVKEILDSERKILLSRGLSEEELGSWDFEILEKENQDWS